MAEKAQEKAGASTQDAVRKAVDKETEQGYRGAVADLTPNENYSLKGVTSGKPTPETERRL